MLIAHLPAGYILSHTTRTKGAVLGAVLFASVLPDFDMLWFHLVDGRSVHHHRYWPHVPAFWLIVAAITLPLIAVLKRQWLLPATLCFAAILLHMVLDTLVGNIMWLWPFSDTFVRLATVSPTHSHWILSFMFHWSFAVEVLICAIAIFLFILRRKQ